MNQERKAQWVADLRAHPELQGNGKLAKIADDGVTWLYCCLGRACELFGPEINLPGVETAMGDTKAYRKCMNYMPRAILQLLELTPQEFHDAGGEWDVNLPFMFRDDVYGSGEEPATLARCNDNGCTFPQIADLIEYFL